MIRRTRRTPRSSRRRAPRRSRSRRLGDPASSRASRSRSTGSRFRGEWRCARMGARACALASMVAETPNGRRYRDSLRRALRVGPRGDRRPREDDGARARVVAAAERSILLDTFRREPSRATDPVSNRGNATRPSRSPPDLSRAPKRRVPACGRQASRRERKRARPTMSAALSSATATGFHRGGRRWTSTASPEFVDKTSEQTATVEPEVDSLAG